MKYYLAYGSNLNIEQMKFRCPTAIPIGTAFIQDYQLLYKGSHTGAYLTIEPRKGSRVPVAVWKVTAADERRLDQYEGFPRFYYKKELRLPVDLFCSDKPKELNTFVYIMDEERELSIPSIFYIRTCQQGYKDFGFDQTYLDEAYLKSAEVIRA